MKVKVQVQSISKVASLPYQVDDHFVAILSFYLLKHLHTYKLAQCTERTGHALTRQPHRSQEFPKSFLPDVDHQASMELDGVFLDTISCITFFYC